MSQPVTHDVWRERYQTSGAVSSANRQRAHQRSFRIRFLEAQLKTHHEVDPLLRTFAQRLHDGGSLIFCQTVGVEYFGHFAHFFFGYFLHLALLALAFLRIMFGVTLGSQVAAQTHGDRTGRDLRQSGGDDNAGSGYGAGQSGRERERYGQTVGHSNNDIAHDCSGSEVPFNVPCLWHIGDLQEMTTRDYGRTLTVRGYLQKS